MRVLSSRPDEAGAVLAFVLLLMLALLVLAHGGLVAALAERAGSRAALRQLRLAGAADHALVSTLSRSPEPWLDSLAPWEARTFALASVGSLETEGSLRRLGPESWLVEGVARSSGGVTARTTDLAWSADPVARVVALGGALTLRTGAAVAVSGSVDTGAPAAVAEPMQAADCDPWSADLAARYGVTPLPLVATRPDSATAPALGLLDFDRLAGAAPVTLAGSGTPAPAEAAGACLVDEPWGWGDPDRPWRPCGPHLPMRVSAGDLEVQGGAGQGLLVVDGDVTLAGETRFYGMIVARGALRLEGGSTFEGMALADGGLAIGPGSTLRASACWAVRALDAQRTALAGLVSVASGIGPT